MVAAEAQSLFGAMSGALGISVDAASAWVGMAEWWVRGVAWHWLDPEECMENNHRIELEIWKRVGGLEGGLDAYKVLGLLL